MSPEPNGRESVRISKVLLDHRKGRALEEGWQPMELARMLICLAATASFLRSAQDTPRQAYTLLLLTCGIRIAMLTETKFSLRQFSAGDLESVIEINRICLPENYASFFFIDTYRSCPSAFIVAESDGRLVGYIMCRIEHGFSDIKRLRFLRKGHVISVAVLPDYRRAGIAMELVKRALQALRQMNADECFLEVRTTNDQALKLYEKLGFALARHVPHYYADGAEAIVMVIPLRPESDSRQES